MRTAQRALQALAEGRPSTRVFHLAGPEGVGRSRLLREIKWEAQKRCPVIEANSSDRNGISQLLASAVDGALKPTTISEVLSYCVTLKQQPDRPLVFVIDDADQLVENQRELLVALARTIVPSAGILLVMTSLADMVVQGPAIERFELEPLTSTDLEHWFDESLSRRTQQQLRRLSGGYPTALRALLQQVVAGACTEQQLAQVDGSLGLSEQRRTTVQGLSKSEQRAIGLLAIATTALLPGELERFSVSTEALDSIVAKGFAQRDGGGWKLIRIGESERLQAALEPELVQQLHRQVADWLATAEPDQPDDARAERAARRTYHLALAGEHRAAAEQLKQNATLHRHAPRAWCRAAVAVASHNDDPDVQVLAAKLERAAGQAKNALTRLQRLIEKVETLSDETPIIAAQLEQGGCRLDLGDTSGAIEQLEAVLAQVPTSDLAGRAAYLLARAKTKQGDYQAASHYAERSLKVTVEPAAYGNALITAGVAASLIGSSTRGRKQLDEAIATARQLGDPRLLVRAHGSRALIAYDAGELSSATADYRAAFELAEQYGLSDQAATAALNLGTACHQAGKWDAALSSYEQGMRLAAALGQLTTEATLRFDLAKLFVDLGLFERAHAMAIDCAKIAEQAGVPLLVAATATIHGEIALVSNEDGKARHYFELARPEFETHGSARENAELELHFVELELRSGELSSAEQRLTALSKRTGELDAKDVLVRLNMLRARLHHASNRTTIASEGAEEALRAAQKLGQRDLEAEAEALCGQLWEAQNSPLSAAGHRRRAREIWERTAAPLDVGIREAFWNHPKRRQLKIAETKHASGPPTGRRDKFARLLDINKRLNSSLSSQQVLGQTMDAAIELTGAERGFLLLADEAAQREGGPPSDLKVAVARNLDREQLDHSHLKFSRGIAQQVLTTGAALVTADAQSDGRFSGEQSVHAMHLKSVICVPVRSPAGVLGALYLDNRFQRGRFTEQDVDVLLAFADQVAIALTNARLHDELKKRHRQLAAEKRRVEQLSKGQAVEIDRLTEQIRKRQPRRRQHRFDYSAIIGSSRALEDLFALLDRVIDTELPILIQGESGTGKELVARAIHGASPRGSGPLVSINCAAVPDTLLESELFGYERGAFTGADRPRDGLLVSARDGTLFLDELGDMPPGMQVKLLRVLQEREVVPLGSTKVIPIDFRLVCATNRILQEEVARGNFREDLFYRISAVEVTLPPLRDRSEDIPELVSHILGSVAEQLKRPAVEVTGQGLRKLMAYSWPGNIRQLEHVITKAVAITDESRISAVDIELPRPEHRVDERFSREAYQRDELTRIAEVLAQNRWNIAKTSRLLGIPRPTLYRKIKRYGLVRPGK